MLAAKPRRSLAVVPQGLAALAIGADPSEPVAILERGAVAGMTPAAREAGIRLAMTRSQVIARDPATRIATRDRFAEERWMASLERRLEEVTPAFQACNGFLAAPIRSCLRYYGSEAAVVSRTERLLEEIAGGAPEFRALAGTGDSVFSARIAARSGRCFPEGMSANLLGSYPVGAVLPPPIARVCEQAGLATIERFQRLRGSSVASRFGAPGLRWHALCRIETDTACLGDLSDQGFSVTVDIEEAQTLEQALFSLMPQLMRVLDAGGEQGMVLSKFSMRLVTQDRTIAKVVEMPDGGSPSEVIARVRWFEQGTREGRRRLLAIEVGAERWVPAKARQLTLSGQEVKDGEVVEVLARLATLYGDAKVAVPAIGGGRSPGEQAGWRPWERRWPQPLPAPKSPQPWPGSMFGHRPSVVVRDALAVEVLDSAGQAVGIDASGLLSGEVRLVVIRGERIEVLTSLGPWLVVERWWEPRRRRYGRMALLTRRGAYVVTRETGRWWLEAAFD